MPQPRTRCPLDHTRGVLAVILILGWARPFPTSAVAQNAPDAARPPAAQPGGELKILGTDGQPAGACPLAHTDVRADIAGFIGRVTVRQLFQNPLDRKIEAIYVFPLPQNAAVDRMVMTVGERRIAGQIKERGEAREIYEAAKAAGHVAGLLDQERPNIFTQSVANIEPGAQVEIEISYVETLKYEDGVFEWVFPMVVGPRYIPGGGSAPAPLTTGQPTPQVPDADKITPPVTPPGTRAGHDIGLTVQIDGGLPIADLQSVLHEIDVSAPDATHAVVALRDQAEIPNRDFVLRYRLATDEIGDAFLVHSDPRGAFFTLILQPPRRVLPAKLVPRELIFVLDSSGSMNGFPIEKAKAVMKHLIDTMRPADTFNLITFSGDTRILWEQPRPANPKNIAEAQKFLAARAGSGGTEMMKAINAALKPEPRPADAKAAPIRVVCFMTDGFVGNDFEIIDAVRKYAQQTRVFAFGIGNSVNRFLLDNMAHAGRGEVEYVTLASQADAAAERFHERILAPVLTDIAIDWGTLPVADVYPRQVPDLFSARPLMIHGRLTGPVAGTITLRGNTGAGAYEDVIRVNGSAAVHDALSALWARAKVDDLMMQDLAAVQQGTFPEELKQQVIALGLEFGLMTQFTSFVAVEELRVTIGGELTTIAVPVEMPAGVSYEGVFGDTGGLARSPEKGAPMEWRRSVAAAKPSAPPPPVMSGGRAAAPAEAKVAGSGAGFRPVPPRPESKHADVLTDLAAKVERDGKDGNLTLGKLRVVSYRVDVMLYLDDMSEATLGALEKLGFTKTGESNAIRLLIGSIDVRKLAELAKLEALIRVTPVQ